MSETNISQKSELQLPLEIKVESLPDVQLPYGPIEIVSLTWEQRSRPRRRCTTDAGTSVALALPRGTVLRHGMLIHNSPARSIQVNAEHEDVLVVRPANQMEMCVVSHHLGNWHRSLQLEDDGALIIESDSPLINWLDRKKINYSHANRSYHPNLKGASHD